MWLAAENGMFLRQNGEEWFTTSSGELEIGFRDSVKVHLHGELCSVVADLCLLF